MGCEVIHLGQPSAPPLRIQQATPSVMLQTRWAGIFMGGGVPIGTGSAQLSGQELPHLDPTAWQMQGPNSGASLNHLCAAHTASPWGQFSLHTCPDGLPHRASPLALGTLLFPALLGRHLSLVSLKGTSSSIPRFRQQRSRRLHPRAPQATAVPPVRSLPSGDFAPCVSSTHARALFTLPSRNIGRGLRGICWALRLQL